VSSEGKFKLLKITKITDVVNGTEKELPESDLCFQESGNIVQYEYEKPEEDDKFKIEPGIYTLRETPNGIRPFKIELRDRELLTTIDNTSRIIHEAKNFYSKLHIYEQLKRQKKRAVLLYSEPGMGKTSAIARFSTEFAKEDPGTVVFSWPTSKIEADDIARFLSTSSEYDSKCTRLVLIMEDIGGGEYENNGRANQVDSGLLNLLDGVDVTFRLPTFIVATTNHPQNLLSSLADRPGRFDLMIKLAPPSQEEKLKLTAFIARRELLPEEVEALSTPKIKNFSIAHLEEVVVRSMLHDKSFKNVIQELIEHKERVKKAFEEKGSLGISLDN